MRSSSDSCGVHPIHATVREILPGEGVNLLPDVESLSSLGGSAISPAENLFEDALCQQGTLVFSDAKAEHLRWQSHRVRHECDVLLKQFVALPAVDFGMRAFRGGLVKVQWEPET